MKNNCCLVERLFNIQKNGAFCFGMSFFVLEMLTFHILQIRKLMTSQVCNCKILNQESLEMLEACS